MKKVICASGLTGWQDRLQKIYKDYEEFEAHCDLYGIHKRIGYVYPGRAWTANPIIQGSVNPSDLCRIKDNKDGA